MKKKWIILGAIIGGIISLWAFLGFLEIYIFANEDWEWEEE